MDVTCERCTTEYEFDETLLSGRGTSVKCTNCGHVFKVYPRAAEESDRNTSSWRLKLHDGSIDTIDSLRELQRRIASGELMPDDEIARGDEGWKTLGSIPELETFFQAAGVHIPSQRIPSPIPPVMPPEERQGDDAPERQDSSLPPGRRPRQATLLGVSPIVKAPGSEEQPFVAPVAAEAVAEAASATATESASASVSASVSGVGGAEGEGLPESLEGPSGPSDSYQSPYTRDSLADTASVEIEDAEFEEKPATPATASVRTSTPPPAYYDTDDDIPELPGRGGSALRWLVLIVFVGALALVATQWNRVARLVGVGSDPALIAAGITEGDAARAEGHPAAYANAIEAYGRAVEAGAEADPEVLARLSNAYALAAQAQLDANAAAQGVEALSAAALSTAESASGLDTRDLNGKLALVDARRLAGDRARARELLEDVRAASFSRTAEFFRVDARLSIDEADGRLDNGLRSARQAAKLDPEGARYLLLLARTEMAAENPERAREALTVVLSDQPAHPVATELLSALDAEVVVEETLDGGAPPEADAAAGEETPGEEVAPSEAEAEAAATEAEPTEAPAKAEAEPEPKKAAAAPKAAPRPRSKSERPAPKKPRYDEYDRLAQAAGSDAFVDGRPPVLDYESNMTKGRAELAAGNYARARAYFDSALEVHPGSAEAMDALGDVATEVSDYASALRYYRVAAQRGHADGYFKLAQTYERLGRNEDAVSAYYTYVKRRPSGKHAADARAAIKSLEPNAKLPPEPGAAPSTESDSPAPDSAKPPVPPAEEAPAQESEPETP